MSFKNKIKKFIYLDNAATTFIDDEYFENEHEAYNNLSHVNINTRSPMSELVHNHISNAKKILLSDYLLLNQDEYDIRITNGATEANQTLINHFVSLGSVLISEYEHPSIYKLKDKYPDKIHLIKVDRNTFQVDQTHLIELLNTIDDVKLVSVMYSNNEIPVLNDINAIHKICLIHNKNNKENKNNKVLFHTDASQYFGKYTDTILYVPDFMTFSLHKFYGKKGYGGLIYKPENITKETLVSYMVEQTLDPIPFIVSTYMLKEKIINKEESRFKSKFFMLRNYLKNELTDLNINYKSIEPDNDNFINPFILLLSFTDKCSKLIKNNLAEKDIIVSVGSACATLTESYSHVIKNLGLFENKGIVRISFSKNTTKDEIDVFLSIISQVLNDSNYSKK